LQGSANPGASSRSSLDRVKSATTLVGQVLEKLSVPSVFVSADEPCRGDGAWLAAQWERARIAAREAGAIGAVLVLDEVSVFTR